jgi:hypothetical protein
MPYALSLDILEIILHKVLYQNPQKTAKNTQNHSKKTLKLLIKSARGLDKNGNSRYPSGTL